MLQSFGGVNKRMEGLKEERKRERTKSHAGASCVLPSRITLCNTELLKKFSNIHLKHGIYQLKDHNDSWPILLLRSQWLVKQNVLSIPRI